MPSESPKTCREDDPLARHNLLGDSAAWQATRGLVRRIAQHDATTLVEGETGTGKELVARAIHYLGARRDFPFIPLNCGALPDNLLEAELFGYEKGAFTDAHERRIGLVAQTAGGTLFLDEVEVMSPRAQVVLLRFLQDQTYLPVGGRTMAKGNVRIVAASNCDLDDEASHGRFRRDLLFRLRVLHIRLPPLRERVGDVTTLARSFLERFSRSYARPPHKLSAGSLALLEEHTWPGNVRELESLILREFLLQEQSADELSIAAPLLSGGSRAPAASSLPRDFKRAKAQAVAAFERTYLRQLLCDAKGNISLAARLSRKDRSALNKLVKKHGIRIEDFRSI